MEEDIYGKNHLRFSKADNKLQIVAFLSFFLFIIFTMSLVLGSVDFTDEGGKKSYSGNKSLDKLYEEADGNETEEKGEGRGGTGRRRASR